ncbi:sigma-70 family RNA polymerase sigma factor [Tessaracoccus sp. OS52]|uniref:RNA polymerase sigma factor n=1 Tax=Tessaracoccus sp. OS52 TaxID=2886691 RepID=UPI001D11A705|nr:sigma-70 family RNA polymerase sigma factor [Tessaracoccus sp. OS52]MCC2593465.1 sigma-70 family RNA polymerase sigma factor [Tessaracoccus sp. OS52]
MTQTSLVERATTLFEDFRDGQPHGFDQLVELLTPTLWHIARSCGLDRSDAQDVVQTAWLRLVDKQATLENPQLVLAWLGTTVRREAWRVRRQQQRSTSWEEPPEQADSAPDPAELVALGQTREILWRHFSTLSPRCRALLRVISRGGPPDYAVLAESLGMPVGSIGPTRGRCLATLRKALSDDPIWSAS